MKRYPFVPSPVLKCAWRDCDEIAKLSAWWGGEYRVFCIHHQRVVVQRDRTITIRRA